MTPPPESVVATRVETTSIPAGADRLSRSRLPTFALGLLGFLYLVSEGWAGRFALSLDTVNLIVLFLALLLHKSAASLLSHVEEASRPLHGVVLQFPLYAGIYGLIKGTGLADRLAEVFLSVANAETLLRLEPSISFLFVSDFVPRNLSSEFDS